MRILRFFQLCNFLQFCDCSTTMAGCMGVTSRAVVAVEAQGYTIHMVAPAVFPVSITVHTWEVWAQHTPNTHRLLLSRRNMFSRQQLRLRPPRYPMSTNVTRTPYTGEWDFLYFPRIFFFFSSDARRATRWRSIKRACYCAAISFEIQRNINVHF